MAYRRILTIQDISCVGQCSMTVALPILSACGHETCILPTALLSTHTAGFGAPAVTHLDGAMGEIWRHWQRNGITFDAILVGYLGSAAAVKASEEIIDALLAPSGVAIVDPAMADNGKLYSGFDGQYAEAIASLCRKADWILPNLTEAAILSRVNYQEKCNKDYVNQLLDQLPYSQVVLTGVGYGEGETGIVVRQGDTRRHFPRRRIGGSFHGTGDMFAACFTGALMQGKSVEKSLEIAAEFTEISIENTLHSPAHWYGVKFETALPKLIKLLQD